MNEEMKDRLLSYMDSVEGGVGKLVNFTEDQVPLLVEDIVRYEIYSNGLSAGVMTCVTVLFVYLVFHARRIGKKLDESTEFNDEFNSWALPVIPGVVAVFSGVVTIDFWHATLKAVVAPRLVVLEYIQEFVESL